MYNTCVMNKKPKIRETTIRETHVKNTGCLVFDTLQYHPKINQIERGL